MPDANALPSTIVHVHVIVRGVVQGVGFRYAAQRLAKRLGIVGTASNRPDGAVEIHAQGPKGVLDLFLVSLSSEVRAASIASVTKEFSTPTFRYFGFEITHRHTY